MDRNYDVITIISQYPFLARPGVVIFADIIKIVTILIKTITKDSRKAKRIRNHPSNSNLCVYFLM